MGTLHVHFRDERIEAELRNMTMRSASRLEIPLLAPLFSSEADIVTHFERAYLRLRVSDAHDALMMDECEVAVSEIEVRLMDAYLTNALLAPMRHLLPKLLVDDAACEIIGESLARLRSRFAM